MAPETFEFGRQNNEGVGSTAVNKLMMDARICIAWRPVDVQFFASGIHVYRI